jgi:hypothetical protein
MEKAIDDEMKSNKQMDKSLPWTAYRSHNCPAYVPENVAVLPVSASENCAVMNALQVVTKNWGNKIEVRPSELDEKHTYGKGNKGLGLFATQDMVANTVVGTYFGKVVNSKRSLNTLTPFERQRVLRVSSLDHFPGRPGRWYIVASGACPSGYSNSTRFSPTGHPPAANLMFCSKMEWDSHPNDLRARGTVPTDIILCQLKRDVRKGEELCSDYNIFEMMNESEISNWVTDSDSDIDSPFEEDIDVNTVTTLSYNYDSKTEVLETNNNAAMVPQDNNYNNTPDDNDKLNSNIIVDNESLSENFKKESPPRKRKSTESNIHISFSFLLYSLL